jgi:hypothetical protein
MTKAGIVIDEWKLPIFERRLREAGYTFDTGPGLMKATLLLTVHTDNLIALDTVVRAAVNEARRSKGAVQ